MSEFAKDEREPLTFSPAQPGWRALFVEDSDELHDFAIPLIGWSLFRITVRDYTTGETLPRARTRIEGVVLQENEAVSVFGYEATTATFESYLSPDQPDPVPPDGKGKPEKPDGGKGGKGRGRRSSG